MRSVCRVRVVMLAVTLALAFGSGRAGAQAPQPVPQAAQDLCKLLPSGTKEAPEPDSVPPGGGDDTSFLCTANYPAAGPQSPDQGRVIFIQQSPAKYAQQIKDGVLKRRDEPRDPRAPLLSRSTSYGDVGFEAVDALALGAAAAGLRSVQIEFARGCYDVQIQQATADKIPGASRLEDAPQRALPAARDAAIAIDNKIKALPSSCPGGAPAAAGALKAGLACDQDRLNGAGEATCAASVTGQRADAQLAFAWTVDGRGRSETGNTIELTGLSPGKHSVGVRARDTKNNLSSTPESVSFTRSGVGASPGPGAGGDFTPAVLAGGGAALAGVLGLLERARRARRGKGAPPARPPALPEPVTAAGPPPDSRPEEPRQRNPAPLISVQLLLEPSVRMQTLQRQAEKSIWGDEADFIYAGYRITVITPDWVRTAMSVEARLDGDGPEFTQGSAPLGNFGDVLPRIWKLRARWSRQPRDMPLVLSVTAEFQHSGTSEIASASATDSARISVIGATPQMELYCDAPADADGTDWALVRPYLNIFGEPYTGGFQLDDYQAPDSFDPFFFDSRLPQYSWPPSGHPFYQDPAQRRTLQGIPLRCQFHLEGDANMQEIATSGAPVSLLIKVTGEGPGDEAGGSEADKVVAAHYRSCAKYLGHLTSASGPGHVLLRGSKIVNEPPDPLTLPRSGGPSSEMYRTRLRLRIVSASGRPVKGEDLKVGKEGTISVGPPGQHWYVKAHYVPPAKPPLSQWDPGAEPSKRECLCDVASIDDDGYLNFAANAVKPLGAGEQNVTSAAVAGSVAGIGAQPWLDFDHWVAFFDPATRYLGGQSCRLFFTLHHSSGDLDVVDQAGKPVEIFVGPPCKLCAYVDTGWLENGHPDGMVGHMFLGLIDENARELKAGFYPDLFLFTRLTDFEASMGVVPAVAILGGLAALAAVTRFAIPMARLSRAGGVIALAAGMIPAAVGARVACTSGTGKMKEDGEHSFHLCRSWDISKDEYERVLARLKEWKRHSDLHELFYDVTGQSAVKFGAFTGNCCTYVTDIAGIVGINVPLPGDFDLRRPGNFAAAFESDPRTERNAVPAAPQQHRHPWIYGPGIHWSVLGMETTLGKVPPPVFPAGTLKVEPYPLPTSNPPLRSGRPRPLD